MRSEITRTTQVKNAEGEWVLADWQLLDVGDVVRFVESDGSLHTNASGHAVFKITEQPVLHVEPEEEN